jgi:hypothetical protein
MVGVFAATVPSASNQVGGIRHACVRSGNNRAGGRPRISRDRNGSGRRPAVRQESSQPIRLDVIPGIAGAVSTHGDAWSILRIGPAVPVGASARARVPVRQCQPVADRETAAPGRLSIQRRSRRPPIEQSRLAVADRAGCRQSGAPRWLPVGQRCPLVADQGVAEKLASWAGQHRSRQLSLPASCVVQVLWGLFSLGGR